LPHQNFKLTVTSRQSLRASVLLNGSSLSSTFLTIGADQLQRGRIKAQRKPQRVSGTSRVSRRANIVSQARCPLANHQYPRCCISHCNMAAPGILSPSCTDHERVERAQWMPSPHYGADQQNNRHPAQKLRNMVMFSKACDQQNKREPRLNGNQVNGRPALSFCVSMFGAMADIADETGGKGV